MDLDNLINLPSCIINEVEEPTVGGDINKVWLPLSFIILSEIYYRSVKYLSSPGVV